LEEGLALLEKVRRLLKDPVITDIHYFWQAEPVSKAVDMLQIPAFLCRQTDLLVAAAKTGLPVNIKKAQFLAPADMQNVVEKMEQAGNTNLVLCERGTMFGYNNLVVDMTAIVEMKKLGYPVIFDATHSVQKPGGNKTTTGGTREHVEYLAKAALAVGADGIFMEVHPDPGLAMSDGPNMVHLDQVEAMLGRLIKVYNAVR
jgi:2-dehydro-3-deoxyphosphooctonate aldolase (KDO 8-P synthase)